MIVSSVSYKHLNKYSFSGLKPKIPSIKYRIYIHNTLTVSAVCVINSMLQASLKIHGCECTAKQLDEA